MRAPAPEGRALRPPEARPAAALDRRRFLGLAGAGLLLPLAGCAAGQPALEAEPRPLRLGVIADVHFGLAPDALARLEAFVAAARRGGADFIVQLGDFCHPEPASDPFLAAWGRFPGPRWHVLGNHDLDRATKAEAIARLGLPGRCYSFAAGGWHFIVLDGNNLRLDGGWVDYAKGNYFRRPEGKAWIDAPQLEWLRRDLAATARPAVVFSHQPLEPEGGVENHEEVRAVLAEANRSAGFQKVAACFCGHLHLDGHRILDGIHFVRMNSASYLWVGERYGRMAPYRDPLFALVTLEPGAIRIEGVESAFLPPNPADRGFPGAAEVTAAIRDRLLPFPLSAGRKTAATPPGSPCG